MCSGSRDIFIFQEITDDISEMVQDVKLQWQTNRQESANKPAWYALRITARCTCWWTVGVIELS